MRGTNIGALRDRVTLDPGTNSYPAGDGGQQTRTFDTDPKRYWASVEALASDKQYFLEGFSSSRISYTVTMRIKEELKNGDRLLWKGRKLSIVGAPVKDFEKGTMVMACSEKAER